MESKHLFKYFHEIDRLASFSNWPFDDSSSCNRAKMAEAGWFASSKEYLDLVECYLCGKELDGWEEEDDPWQEHQKHSPNCKFVKLGKKEKEFKIKDLMDITDFLLLKYIEKQHQAKKAVVTKQFHTFLKTHYSKEMQKKFKK